jgi:Domain of unknown function (DUF1707)
MPPPSESEPASQESPLERQPPLTSTIRVSAQERDETVQRLQTAFVEGRLNDEEFDEHVRAALAARTRMELERLLADLPAPHIRQAQPMRPGSVRRGDSLVIAMMGGAERRGRWRVPEQCTAVAMMGGCSLDLRAAQLSAPVITINVVAIMGGVEVIVPPGVRVEMHGLPLMGGWSNHVPDAELPPDAPEVHVRGFALMGGVEVRTKKPKRQA